MKNNCAGRAYTILSRVADQISVPIRHTICIGVAFGTAPLMSVGSRSAAVVSVGGD